MGRYSSCLSHCVPPSCGARSGLTETSTYLGQNSGAGGAGSNGGAGALALPPPTRVKAIAAGNQHSCALLSNGTVKCWGLNSRGQLGDGSSTASSLPLRVVGISTATAIAVGYAFSCALLAGGAIKCWGLNNQGQLGDGTTVDRYEPTNVLGITAATSVAIGAQDGCAPLSTALVWGKNYTFIDTPQGPSSMPLDTVPVVVAGIDSAYDISVGNDHSCALLYDSNVECWGHNQVGQLGDGTTNYSLTPVTVVGLAQ